MKKYFSLSYLLWIIVVIALMGLIVIVFNLFFNLINNAGNFSEFWKKMLETGDNLAIKDIIIGITAFITLTFWFVRLRNIEKQTEHAQKNIELQKDAHMDQQFVDVMKILSDKEADIRAKLGAISILGSLGSRSSNHTQRCIDFLTGFNTWMPKALKDNPNYFYREKKSWREEIGGELRDELSKAALTSIETIISNIIKVDENIVIDLSAKILCTINLSELNLNKRVILCNSNLSHAKFYKTNLESTELYGSVFNGSSFLYANLKKSQAQDCELRNCSFFSADLRRADLTVSDFKNSNLRFADLRKTKWSSISEQEDKKVFDGAIDWAVTTIKSTSDWEKAKYDDYLWERLNKISSPQHT